MLAFLKSLFGGGGAPGKAGKEAKAVDYNGFTISARPRQRSGGWSTEAVLSKRFGDGDSGEVKEHIFIRADASPSKDEAVGLIVSKAKMLIDQQGDDIFS